MSPDLSNVFIDGRPLAPAAAIPAGGHESYFVRGGSSSNFQAFAPLIYPDPQIAMAEALPSAFTIAKPGLVGFAIPDETLSDNLGGVSLRVELRP